MSQELSLYLLVAIALAFDFLNGFHDSANVVATLIASRAMSPRAALWMAAAAELAGPFLLGTAVAHTLGNQIAPASSVGLSAILAALLSASLWNILTWWLGIPSSSSHALIGGLVGAVSTQAGWEVIHPDGLIKVGLALVLSPLLGFTAGALLLRLTLWLARDASPAANQFFKLAQIPASLVLALSHGANDAQKTVGMISMGLVALGIQRSFSVPLWVIIASAAAIALGTALGGWRIIRTLGGKFFRLRPVHGFGAQSASALVILGASLLGGPVSTTQVVSTAIMGTGAAQRKSQVRWGVLGEIAVAWLLTIPLNIGLGAGLAYLLGFIW